MVTTDFRQVREVLRGLALSEADLAAGDATVDRLAKLRQAIDRLDTTDEPWVAEWLTAEHLKAAVLHTAAKTSWRKEHSHGADRTFNARTRAVIVDRFNTWVIECRSHLSAYERPDRSVAAVAQRQRALERFHQDPVNNP